MSERMLTNTCDDGWNPNLLLYCDQSQNGLPFRTQFKIAGSVPVKYGINMGVAFQSLPGYVYGTTSQYALTGVSGPSGITTNNPPAGLGSVYFVTEDHGLHRQQPLRRAGQVHGRPAGRPGHHAGVAVGPAGGADDTSMATASTSST